VKRKITIADVAEAAGVSRQTVSRVLNAKGEISAETRERVRRVIERLGYRPHVMASGLAGGRARCIGLIVTQPADEAPTNPFFLSVIYGASLEAEQRRYALAIKYAPAETVLRLRERLFERGQVDGMIILRAHRECAQAFAEPRPERAPVLLIGDFPPECPCPSLDIDNAQGMRLLAEHLLEHGYKRIAILCHGPPGHATADARLHAALEVLQGHGVPVPPEFVLWTNSTLHDAYRQTRRLLSSPRLPRAIMVTNDWTAMAVLRAARDAGLRVPEDVAVTGFDDLPLAPYLEPPLTTVVFSGFDLGREAMRWMIEYVETAQPPPRAYLPVRLVIRRSCGCPYPELSLESRACAPAAAQDADIVQDSSTSGGHRYGTGR